MPGKMVRMSIRTNRRLAARRGALALLITLTLSCSGASPPDVAPTAASPTLEKKEPRVARFETGFTVLTMSGISCDGIRGPWRVRVEAPDPIEGSDRTTFRLAEGDGPARMRWSFEASHPLHGTITYSGSVRVRSFVTPDGTVLRFSGEQTSVGVTAPVVGSADVRFGGACDMGS